MTDTETKQVMKCNSEVQAILKKYGCELYLQNEYNRIYSQNRLVNIEGDVYDF